MLVTLSTTRGALGADWSNTLDVSPNLGYVTNPQLLPGSNVSDEFAQFSGDGNSTYQTDRTTLSLTPRFSLIRYENETNLNVNSGSVDLALTQKLERGQWTLEGLALTDSTLTSELGLSGITDVNLHHDLSSISAGYQYQSTERLSWSVQGNWQDTHYTDAAAFGLTDYGYITLQAGPSWSFTERLSGSLTLEADRLSPDGGFRQDSYTASAQLKRAFNEQYSWHVSAGGTRVDVQDVNSKSSPILEAGATRQGERTQWDISVRRSVQPIGLGLLAREDTATLSVVTATTERSTLAVSFNLIHSDPVFYLSYVAYSGASWGALNAEWKYRFSPRWGISAAFAQSRARAGGTEQWANGTQARLGIFWQSNRL